MAAQLVNSPLTLRALAPLGKTMLELSDLVTQWSQSTKAGFALMQAVVSLEAKSNELDRAVNDMQFAVTHTDALLSRGLLDASDVEAASRAFTTIAADAAAAAQVVRTLATLLAAETSEA